jgi:glutamate formiminotransferase
VPEELIECVPNFSEGRDAATVEAIAGAIRSVPGITLLDRQLDPDHNRSVITFAGPPEAAAEAAVRAVGQATALIDLNRHQGAHPRIGAADVVPFVPLRGVTLSDCAGLARSAGERIWKRLGVPVYFYGAAALRPDRRNLADVRRGQFEGLREEVQRNPDRRPDLGEARLHPTAGATAVGARRFLIAYNINLTTPDLALARQIARKIRDSSGGFPRVRAMGVLLGSRGLAQVSMNLTDFERIPVDCVFEVVENEARRAGAGVASSEIVGLIPRKAFDLAPEFYRRAANFRPEVILENRLAGLESK